MGLYRTCKSLTSLHIKTMMRVKPPKLEAHGKFDTEK